MREHWRDGQLALLLRRQGATLRRLPDPRGGLSAAPTWSRDGQRIRLVTLEEVLVYDLGRRRSYRFDLRKRLPADSLHLETRIRDVKGDLEIAADTALLSSYRVWRWTPGGPAMWSPSPKTAIRARGDTSLRRVQLSTRRSAVATTRSPPRARSRADVPPRVGRRSARRDA